MPQPAFVSDEALQRAPADAETHRRMEKLDRRAPGVTPLLTVSGMPQKGHGQRNLCGV
jgi:hypothetical protein